MKVSIVKDWHEPDIFRQTPGEAGIWDGVSFVNGNSLFADVVVVLNASPKNIFGFYRKGGKWLMSQEPPHEFYRWQTAGYVDFDTIFTFWNQQDFPIVNLINTQTCLPWHVAKNYDELIRLKPTDIGQKKDSLSWVTSNLNTRPGHTLRLSFMDFLKNAGFDFSLYGRGFEPINDKYDGIAPFKYSLAIENFACNDYWTEKIADCFLSWTMPVYYGCRNITDYFPKDSMVLIDPNDSVRALALINEAIRENRWEKNIQQIQQARELVLNEYQFFPAITKKLKAIELGKRKLSFIRKPMFR